MLRCLLVTTLLLAACDRGAAVPDLKPCDIPGLPNCVQSGDVILGGQPSPATLRYLASEGVTTVVSTRGRAELSWDERGTVEAFGMRFVHIPMDYPILGITDAQIAALDSALAAPRGRVLLHCNSGNRTAGLWGAWLAERRGVAPAAAVRLAQQAGMGNVRTALEARLRER
jgi:uncharacterized protein (TIGR01244 family)